LSGHLHLGRSGSSAVRYPGSGALLVLAGTATSTRVRGGEPNAFNVLELDARRLTLHRYEWQPAQQAFSPTAPDVFMRTAHGWEIDDR
jgi:hypothetical protein